MKLVVNIPSSSERRAAARWRSNSPPARSEWLAQATIDAGTKILSASRPRRSVPSELVGGATCAQKAKRVAAVAMQVDAGSDWIDQYRSPLGRRKHMDLCRKSIFSSARKDGKQWLVRRAEIDAYILQQGKPQKAADVSDIDRELAALGMLEP